MTKIIKLRNRVENLPKDFTYDEAKRILNHLGFKEDTKGKTSGSRVIFVRESDNRKILLHKPHPGNTLKRGAVEQLRDFINEVMSSE